MRKCRFCAEEIQDAAIVCKHCGRDLIPGRTTTPPPPPVVQLPPAKKKTSLGTLFVGFLLLVLIGWCSSLTNRLTSSRTTSTPAASNAPASAPVGAVERLALLSARGYQSDSGNYWYVEGQVKNLSEQSLKNVEVVATWYSKDGTFITADSALIEYNPLMPGQTSSFKTMTRGNPLMSKFNIGFKQLMGGSIATRDDRK